MQTRGGEVYIPRVRILLQDTAGRHAANPMLVREKPDGTIRPGGQRLMRGYPRPALRIDTPGNTCNQAYRAQDKQRISMAAAFQHKQVDDAHNQCSNAG